MSALSFFDYLYFTQCTFFSTSVHSYSSNSTEYDASITKVMGLIPREWIHRMHYKSLWIKASAKQTNVSVRLSTFAFNILWPIVTHQHQMFFLFPILHCLDILARQYHWKALCCHFMPCKPLTLHSSMALRVWLSPAQATVPVLQVWVHISWVCCGSYFLLCYVRAASDDKNADEGLRSTTFLPEKADSVTLWGC